MKNDTNVSELQQVATFNVEHCNKLYSTLKPDNVFKRLKHGLTVACIQWLPLQFGQCSRSRAQWNNPQTNHCIA